MKAVKMNVVIGSDRRLNIALPEQVQEGPAELILLCQSDKEAAEDGKMSGRVWIDNILSTLPEGKSREELDGEIDEQRNSWE